MRLRDKLILIFLVIALIPVLCLGFLLSFSLRTSMEASFRNSLLALASIQEARAKEAIENYLVKVLLVTSRTRLRELIEAQSLKEDPRKALEISRILADAAKSGALHEISVLDLKGRVIASTEPSEMGKNYSNERFFKRGKEACSVVDIVRDSRGRLDMIVSGPFLKEGRLIGVALVKDSAGYIVAIAGDYTGMGRSGETTLAKRDGNGDALYIVPVRFRSDAAMSLRIPRGDVSRSIIRALNGEETYIQSALDYRGVEVSAATRYIPTMGWGLTVEIDRAEVLQPVKYLYAVLSIGGTFILSLVIGVILYVSRAITAPVMRLEIAARGISRGDYTCRAEVTTKDELAALAQSFNEMAENLFRSRGELERKITDMESLEEELRRTGAYNRSLIEASLDPLVTISAEGKITDVNEATIAVTGVSRDLLIGTDFSDYFTEPEKAREGYRQVFEKGFVTDYPLTIRHSDGRLTEVLYNASVYRDESGSVLGVFAAARDVTESRRVMAELAETKNFLNNILQSSTKYSIIGKDLNNSILSWNEGARLNYGYAEEEILGKNSSILHIPEDLDSGAVAALLKTAFEKGLAEGEFRRVRKDGSRFDATVVVMRRNDSSGRPIGYLLMSTDITEKKLAEERLRYASRYARSLIEASLDPLVTISAEGKISDVNRATEEVTGYDRSHLVGTDFSDSFTEPLKAQQGYQKVFRDGAVKDYPLEIRHRDGHTTPVLYNASLFRDEAGNVMGIFAAARDITERKALEEELRRTGAYNRSLIEASLDPLVTISAEGKISDVNRATEEVTG
ncbi:MAG: PAS domain S-box protein, partial [Thermodesulfovibrionales bacterium]